MKIFVCPCCHQETSAKLTPDQLPLLFPQPVKGRIIRELVRRMRDYTPIADIAAAIYRDSRGGPRRPSNCISVLLRQMRAKIAPYGYTIASSTRAGVRLILLENKHEIGRNP